MDATVDFAHLQSLEAASWNIGNCNGPHSFYSAALYYFVLFAYERFDGAVRPIFMFDDSTCIWQ